MAGFILHHQHDTNAIAGQELQALEHSNVRADLKRRQIAPLQKFAIRFHRALPWCRQGIDNSGKLVPEIRSLHNFK